MKCFVKKVFLFKSNKAKKMATATNQWLVARVEEMAIDEAGLSAEEREGRGRRRREPVVRPICTALAIRETDLVKASLINRIGYRLDKRAGGCVE